MSDSLQATSPPFATGHTVARAMRAGTILRPSLDVQGTSMEGETVLLDVSTGRYYTLNRLGSVIWEHCTGHHTIDDIHAVLCDRFDVAPEQVPSKGQVDECGAAICGQVSNCPLSAVIFPIFIAHMFWVSYSMCCRQIL